MSCAERFPGVRRRDGFSLVELSVVALLVAILLLIAGQIFVELIRRQKVLGQGFLATEGFVAWDAVLAHDAREATDLLLSLRDWTKSANVLLLALPPEADGTTREVAWEFGAGGGAKRTLVRNGEATHVREYSTAGVVTWEEDALARRIVAFGVFDPESEEMPPPALLWRVVTMRNVVG